MDGNLFHTYLLQYKQQKEHKYQDNVEEKKKMKKEILVNSSDTKINKHNEPFLAFWTEN